MLPSTDRDLVPRIADDPAAFETLYRRHVRAVTRFAARRSATASDVADVVSNTFLSALDGAGRFDPRRGTARAWLLGIAAHELTALQRKERSERTVAGRAAVEIPLVEDDIARLEARIEAERLAPAISAALADAPPSERELFLLVAYEELTPSEAARVLGISPIAARVRLSRVRRRLTLATDQSATPAPSTIRNLENIA